MNHFREFCNRGRRRETTEGTEGEGGGGCGSSYHLRGEDTVAATILAFFDNFIKNIVFFVICGIITPIGQ
jgi:hypothetical protein